MAFFLVVFAIRVGRYLEFSDLIAKIGKRMSPFRDILFQIFAIREGRYLEIYF